MEFPLFFRTASKRLNYNSNCLPCRVSVFEVLEWLTTMCSQVPNKGEQLVRYYGFYSNVGRGKWKKQDQDE